MDRQAGVKLRKRDSGCVPNSLSRAKANWILKGPPVPLPRVHRAGHRRAASPALVRVHKQQGPSQRQLLCFMAIKIFEGLEFLNQSLVLVFKHSHTVFKTSDIFLLLPATLPGGFPGTNTRQMTTGTTSYHPDWLNKLPPNATAKQSYLECVCTKPRHKCNQAHALVDDCPQTTRTT